jgi:hypothetical protein
MHLKCTVNSTSYYHHQPINVPTAGAQAFLMDYPQGDPSYYTLWNLCHSYFKGIIANIVHKCIA